VPTAESGRKTENTMAANSKLNHHSQTWHDSPSSSQIGDVTSLSLPKQQPTNIAEHEGEINGINIRQTSKPIQPVRCDRARYTQVYSKWYRNYPEVF
jgi:hypothetical protein